MLRGAPSGWAASCSQQQWPRFGGPRPPHRPPTHPSCALPQTTSRQRRWATAACTTPHSDWTAAIQTPQPHQLTSASGRRPRHSELQAGVRSLSLWLGGLGQGRGAWCCLLGPRCSRTGPGQPINAPRATAPCCRPVPGPPAPVLAPLGSWSNPVDVSSVPFLSDSYNASTAHGAAWGWGRGWIAAAGHAAVAAGAAPGAGQRRQPCPGASSLRPMPERMAIRLVRLQM